MGSKTESFNEEILQTESAEAEYAADIEQAIKVKPKKKRKKREPITYDTYARVMIIATAVFFISRVSMFKCIFPFGISLVTALVIADIRNIFFLPVGLIGIYTATMSLYMSGADLCVMTISTLFCFFIGRRGVLINGTKSRIRKNREQILLILAILAVITKIVYHAVMDLILTYDVIMAVAEGSVLLTATFAFLILYDAMANDKYVAVLRNGKEALCGMWRRRSQLYFGFSLAFALALIYAGIYASEIVQMKMVYIFCSLFLIMLGHWTGNHTSGNNDKLMSKIQDNLRSHSDIFEKLQLTYERAVQRQKPVDASNKREIVEDAQTTICRSCQISNDCWEIYAGRACRYIEGLARKCENRVKIEGNRLDEKNGFTCRNRELMEFFVRERIRFYESEYRWQKKIENSREAMSIQFRGITRSIYKIIGELELDAGAETKAARPIDIQTGTSCSSDNGGVSGDSHLCMPLSKKEYMIAISDGMGSGKRAGEESLLTVNMLYDFMRAGFDVELALAAMNSMLLIKSTEEIFSTVDLAIINLDTSRMKLYKIGAATAFIKRDTAVTTIKQAALPMGIINQIQIEDINVKLLKGDMVIMVSDGITDADRDDLDGGWLEQAIREIGSRNPQTVADLITKEASERYGERERDDMTVVVVGIR